jgi:NitT/TauT family transport system substrate-binding protein
MQSNQLPSSAPTSDKAYWQQRTMEIDRRTRRQFLSIASGVSVGTALLFGGLLWYERPKSTLATSSPTVCNPALASSSGNTSTAGIAFTTLKVCQINTSINFFPFYVAQQKGYFTAQRLNIPTPPLLQVGSKVVAAVKAGKYDIGNGVITDAFNWALTDSSARIIGSIMNGYIVDVIVSKKLEQETGVSATSSLADKINALRGKTIGITGPGSGTQALLTYLFTLQGMDAAKDATQVSLGSNNTAALAALKAGLVDALSFFSPVGQAAEARGIGDILISPVRGDVPGLRGDVHGVIYTSQSVIDAKPQAIASYIRALYQAEVFIRNNPAAAKVLLNHYLGLGQKVSDAVYAATAADIATTPVINQASYNVAGQFHLKAGLVSIAPSYSQLVATSTINSALNSTAC